MESLALIVSSMLLTTILFPIAAMALFLYNRKRKSYIVLAFQVIFSIFGLVTCGNWVCVAPFPVKLIGNFGIGLIICISAMTIKKLFKD